MTSVMSTIRLAIRVRLPFLPHGPSAGRALLIRSIPPATLSRSSADQIPNGGSGRARSWEAGWDRRPSEKERLKRQSAVLSAGTPAPRTTRAKRMSDTGAGLRTPDRPPGTPDRPPAEPRSVQLRSSGKSSSVHSPSILFVGSACSSCSRPRRSTRRILPEMVLGSSENSRRRTRL